MKDMNGSIGSLYLEELKFINVHMDRNLIFEFAKKDGIANDRRELGFESRCVTSAYYAKDKGQTFLSRLVKEDPDDGKLLEFKIREGRGEVGGFMGNMKEGSAAISKVKGGEEGQDYEVFVRGVFVVHSAQLAHIHLGEVAGDLGLKCCDSTMEFIGEAGGGAIFGCLKCGKSKTVEVK